MRKYFGIVLLISFSVSMAFAQYQPKFEATGDMLYSLDSNTVKLRNKLYTHTEKGDLNIYGFEENDIPVYADSVYAYRLSLLESQISLDYNEYVRPYIDLYTIKKRALSSKVLAWSQYYFPSFEEALDKAGMPMELKYLAVIESALNPHATSRVGAAGMWQFMAPTGRMYGLKTNSQYDERRDVAKATEAAIKYLQNSYRVYGDWLLVIASYNCGPGNVNKAIRRAGGVKDFWAIQQYLPRETRGYVPAFIAATYMMNYASEHNIYPADDIAINFYTDTIHIDNRYNLNILAVQLGMTVDEIKEFNPALRRDYIPFTANGIALTLPYDKALLFTQMQSDPVFKAEMDAKLIALNKEVEHAKPGKNGTSKTIYYRVKKGDMLGTIADRFDVSVKEIKKWNRISGSKINPGQRLKINRA